MAVGELSSHTLAHGPAGRGWGINIPPHLLAEPSGGREDMWRDKQVAPMGRAQCVLTNFDGY